MAQWTVRMFLRKGEWDVRFNRTSDGPQSVKNYVGKDSWAGTGSFWRSLIDSPVKQTNWTRHSLKVFLQSHIEISTILNLQIGHSNIFTQQLKVYFWDTSKCYVKHWRSQIPQEWQSDLLKNLLQDFHLLLLQLCHDVHTISQTLWEGPYTHEDI